jgi:hypothetical protein
VGGSVANPLSLNAYLYCRNDPVNLIDPTGMVVTEWDKANLSSEQQAAIQKLTDAYYAAPDKAGRDAAHNAAQAIRDGVGNTPKPPTGVVVPSYDYSAYYRAPTTYEIIITAISKTQPKLSLEQVRKTAAEWMALSAVPSTAKVPVNPTPLPPKNTTSTAGKNALTSSNIPTGVPNSSIPIYNSNGNQIGIRYFGPDGKAIRDIDLTDHGNPKAHPNVPHQHEWDQETGKRGDEIPVPNNHKGDDDDHDGNSSSGNSGASTPSSAPVSGKSSLGDKIVGGGLIVIGALGTAALILDDALGIGVLDDPAIAITGSMVIEGISRFA